MSEVDCLADLPEYKADRTVETTDNAKFLHRSDPAGTALHHYTDLGARESMTERIVQGVDEKLARLDSDTGGGE